MRVLSIFTTALLLTLGPVAANDPPPLENDMGDESCDDFKKQGMCKSNEKFMAEFCEKTYHDCILEQALKQAEESKKVKASGSNLTDGMEENICKQMAKEKKCETQPGIMEDFCAKTCHDLKMSRAYFKSITIDDDDDEIFYDLKAKNWTGSTIHFDSFDGFITSVINVGIACQPGEGEMLASNIELTRKVMPSTLELLIFPFNVMGGELDLTACESFDPLLKMARKNTHIMEIAEINGPNTHPVYKFLKGKADMKGMREDYPSFFFVNPMGTQIDVLEAQPFSKLKEHADNYLHKWDEL